MAAASASGVTANGLGRARGQSRARRPPPATASPLAGLRWDRIGRLALLFVLAALAYLSLSAVIHVLSKFSEDRHHTAAVAALKREHALLSRQHEALARQTTVEAEARQLGMIKPGEQPYVVTGLPAN